MPNKGNCSVEPVTPLGHDMPNAYKVGDLVWAKVKSHPWWPGQIFNVVYASDHARSLEKPGRVLVAFYGDHTFAWLEHSQIVEFEPHFDEKAEVAGIQVFQDAVSEALDEVRRRACLGLQCHCCESLWENDLDDGIEGTLRLHKDVLRSKEILDARRTLSFLKELACSPYNPCRSSVNAAVVYGHILGIWARISAGRGQHGTLEEGLLALTGKDETSEQLVFNSAEKAVNGPGEVQSRVELGKWGHAGHNKRIFPLEHCERAKRRRVAGLKVDNEEKERASNPGEAGRQTTCSGNGVYGTIRSCNKATDEQTNTVHEVSRECIMCFSEEKLQVRDQKMGATPLVCELSSFCNDDRATHFLMQIFEALRFVAADPMCHRVSFDIMVRKMAVILKFRDLVFRKSAGYLQNQPQIDAKMKDAPAPHVGGDAGAADYDSSNLVPRAVQYWRPAVQKQRTFGPHNNQAENLQVPNSTKAQRHLQCAASTEACREGKKLSPGKAGMVSGMGFGGVSQAGSWAPGTISLSQKLDVHELLIKASLSQKLDVHELTKEAPARLDVQKLLIEAHEMKSDCTVEVPLLEAQKKKSEHAKAKVPAKVLKKALKTSGEFFSEVHRYVSVGPKQHSETRSLKCSDEEIPENASKMSSFKGSVFSEAIADIDTVYVDRFSRANTLAKGILEQFSESLPGIGVPVKQESTTNPSKHDIHGAVCANGNMEAYNQVHDNRASSHDCGVLGTEVTNDDACSRLPVGLFIRFPSNVSLPLETQLNAMFAAFGGLETTETRVFRETASAQVIFKHGDEAEAALKCVKVVNPFGKARVMFRLRHFAHPLGVLILQV